MLNEEQRGRFGGRVAINGIQYSAGLFWQLADDPTRVGNEARAIARTDGVDADFVCVLSGSPAQYGLGWKDADHKGGDRPLAIAATEAIGTSFIGCFPIDGRWWFVSAKDGVVSPDGDALFQDETAARDRFESAYAETGEDVAIYTPEDWGIPGARDTDLASLIETPPTVKLAATETALARFRVVFLMAAVMIICVIGIGGWLWHNQEINAEARDRERQLIQQALAQADPWLKQPLPSEVLRSCYEGFVSLPVLVPGWQLESAQCQPGSLSSNWVRRPDGLIGSLRLAAEQNGFTFTVQRRGELATLSKSVARPDNRSGAQSADSLWQAQEIRESLWELGNRVGVDFTVEGGRSGPPAAPPRGADGRPLDIPPPPSSLTFEVEAAVPITTWSEIFDALPGVVVNRIQLDNRRGSWVISGNVYELQQRAGRGLRN